MPTPKRVRIMFNGAIVADTLGTSGALYVWEHERYPQFYLPMEAFVKPEGFDVDLIPGDGISDSPTGRTVIAGFLRLSVKHHGAPDSDYKSLTEMILFAADLQGPGKVLRSMVKVKFDAVGQWFEEETPIYVHPKDPFKRVDILSSTRPIRVHINGVKVAESAVAMHLYETTLPCRYYVPLTSIDTSLLRLSLNRTQCPYKGEASYHSISAGGNDYKDICWYYTHPTIECAAITGLVCFYHEHKDVKLELKGKNGEWQSISTIN